jgi:hypothetical protein
MEDQVPTIPRQTSNQESNTSARIPRYLLALLAVYCVASLIHFVHNAEFVSAYPNLPAGLTRSKVYLAWLAITAVGAAGIFVVRLGARLPGLLLIAAYAALGFAGLDHYWVAAVSAHTLAMNATIWFEVAAAGALCATTMALVFQYLAVKRASVPLPRRDDERAK